MAPRGDARRRRKACRTIRGRAGLVSPGALDLGGGVAYVLALPVAGYLFWRRRFSSPPCSALLDAPLGGMIAGVSIGFTVAGLPGLRGAPERAASDRRPRRAAPADGACLDAAVPRAADRRRPLFFEPLDPLDAASRACSGARSPARCPGFNQTLAVGVMIPFTFAFGPVEAVTFLVSIGVGVSYGNSIPAILVGLPGTAFGRVHGARRACAAQARRERLALGAQYFAAVSRPVRLRASSSS